MTPANWIMAALVLAGLIITAAGWFIAIGRQGNRLDETDKRVQALDVKVDTLETDMREVGEMKQQLDSHSKLTSQQFESIKQQVKDGFTLVANEQRSFDRLVTLQLDEIKHRLRDPATTIRPD